MSVTIVDTNKVIHLIQKSVELSDPTKLNHYLNRVDVQQETF